jgi:2-polyprenyl-6-methoxyphenol hydroxylase-like FAD-dependent oxidoreductase
VGIRYGNQKDTPMIQDYILASLAAARRDTLLAAAATHRSARQARGARKQPAMRRRNVPAPTRSTRHDVIVVGSRCAGAATAMLLARAGHDVALVDRALLPSDTLSTHGIARGGVVQLSRWGLLNAVLASGAPPVRRVTFGVDGELIVRGIKDRAGVDMLVAPRRHILDALLADAARDAGVHLLTEVTATAVLRDGSGRVIGITTRDRRGGTAELTGRYVIGADGLRSSIAGYVGAQTVDSFTTNVGLFYAYVASPSWNGFEFHVAPSSFAGVFPTHDGQACVWLCRPVPLLQTISRAGSARGDALVAELMRLAPSVGERARAGHLASPVRGVARMPNYVRESHGPGWALVGDAGYHRDPITGHGMTDAFRDAELLAVAIGRSLRDPRDESSALAGYERARAAALRETFELTRTLTAFPPPPRFAELQIQLSKALDREAHMLASLPEPPGTRPAAPAA